jgi:hypothetical protein
VPRDHRLAFLVQLLDEQVMGTGDVLVRLALLNPPILFCNMPQNLMPLPPIEDQPEHLLNSLCHLGFIALT